MLFAKLYPTLCNPMDYSSPDSSVHAITQARIPEWVAVPFFTGSSLCRDHIRVSCTGSWILECSVTKRRRRWRKWGFSFPGSHDVWSIRFSPNSAMQGVLCSSLERVHGTGAGAGGSWLTPPHSEPSHPPALCLSFLLCKERGLDNSKWPLQS